MSGSDQLEFLANSDARRIGKRFSWGSLVLVIGIVAVALVLALQLARRNTTQPTSGQAPDFQLTLIDGREIRLSDYRGQVVLINFWASWCPPCRGEAPELQMLYQDFSDEGFTIIGVNILESSPEKALGFLQEFGISYPNGEDTGQVIANRYRVEAPPESFLINKRGDVQRFVLGGLRYDDLSESITRLLAEKE